MPSADYVIVGRRLGRLRARQPPLRGPRGASVLLLEAGGRGLHPNIAIPAAFAKQFHTKLDWDYATEPEPHCDGRSLYLPRGKGLGGSSGMNAMLYVRGRPLDYDLWERRPAGAGTTCGPYFLKAEDNARGASEHHATGGPLRVEDERSPRPLTRRFLAAAEATGIPLRRRLQRARAGRRRAGPGHPAAAAGAGAPTTPTCARCATARTSRSSPAPPSSASTLAGGRATGVALPRPARPPSTAPRPAREVILAAGAFGSPQILMLSGHRPRRAAARASAIDVARRRSRGSARTSRTTRSTPSSARSREGSLVDAEHPRYLAEWLLRRSGPLTSTVAEAFAFVRTPPGPARARPPVPLRARLLRRPRGRGVRRPRDDARAGADHAPQPRHRAAALGRPGATSRAILTNSLAEPEDVAAMVAGHADRPRDRRRRRRCARSCRREIFPGPEVARRRPRGRPAPPRRAALPPGRHLPDGHRRRRGGRRAAARARRRGPARGRRLDHAADPGRQHQRADDHDRRARRRPDPRRRRCRREPASAPDPAHPGRRWRACGPSTRRAYEEIQVEIRERLADPPGVRPARPRRARRTPTQDARQRALLAAAHACAATGSPTGSNIRQQSARLRQRGDLARLLDRARAPVPRSTWSSGSSPCRRRSQRPARACMKALHRWLDDVIGRLRARRSCPPTSRSIARQQAAIRQISTPVLQLRAGLLILPIVGALDRERLDADARAAARGDPRPPRPRRWCSTSPASRRSTASPPTS